jgi:hypothetical protein
LINQSFSIMDKRKDNGGNREGAGRKPKILEIELIERLSPMEDEALKQLAEGVKSGDYRFVSLYLAYRYGKPKESLDVKSNGESINMPIIKWASDE